MVFTIQGITFILFFSCLTVLSTSILHNFIHTFFNLPYFTFNTYGLNSWISNVGLISQFLGFDKTTLELQMLFMRSRLDFFFIFINHSLEC